MPDLLTLNLANTSNRALKHYHVTHGVPLAAGVLSRAEAEQVHLRQPDGQCLSVQTQVLECHADGSVRWLLLDFGLALAANQKLTLTLVKGDKPTEPTQSVGLVTTLDAYTFVQGPASISVAREQAGFLSSWQVNGRELLQPGGDAIIEDRNGKCYYASLARQVHTRLLVSGPARVVIEQTGRHTAEDGTELLDFRYRYTMVAGDPVLRVAYKFTNREAPEQGVTLRRIRLQQPLAFGRTTRKLVRQTNHGKDWFSRRLTLGENVELMNYGAINAAAKERYGASAEGKILIRNMDSLGEKLGEYPYFLRPGNARTDMTGGLRQMYPYIGVQGESAAGLTWIGEMELHYPKALLVARNLLTWDLWPEFSGDLKWRRGMAKEHELALYLTDQVADHETLEGVYFDHEIVGMGVFAWPHAPVTVTFDPAYAVTARVLDLDRWLPYDLDRYSMIEERLGSAGTSAGLPSKGMMDVGDHISGDRSWAHNNENDAILNLMREYFRKADASFLYTSVQKARHNAHIDFIAHDPDPLRQGTMPAHCPEHTDGATYPSHMWNEGLLAAYCLTGEPDFREVAVAVGENMIRWQKDNPTIFYADSRECGWPMLAWLRLHEHDGDPRWLAACHEVYEFYRDRMTDEGMIYYELPHGVGTSRTGYGEFIGWRSCFFYWERTQSPEVKAFLVKCLTNPKVYLVTPEKLAHGGWACNDLFPAWAASELTGDPKYLQDNLSILKYMMKRGKNFPWGGVDMHYYLGALHRRGELAACQE